MKLPVQVGDEHGKTSVRGLAKRVEQRARFSALTSRQRKALLRYDRIAGHQRVAKLQTVSVVARRTIGELIAEAFGDLGQLIVVHRERGVVGLRTETQHLL